MNKSFRALLIITTFTALATLAAAGEARAEVPARVTFTARLVNGDTAFGGSVQVGLRLFRAASGGTSLWAETHTATAVAGLVSLGMGDQTPLDASVVDGSPLYLQVTVDGTDLSPRLAIGSVPYALMAGRAESATKLGTLAEADVQRRTATTNNLTCPAGQYMRTIAQNGQATCVPALTCSRVGGATGATSTQTVSCPAGNIVMGGGCSSPSNATILDSYPGSTSGWFCRTTPGAPIQAIAVCCDVSF